MSPTERTGSTLRSLGGVAALASLLGLAGCSGGGGSEGACHEVVTAQGLEALEEAGLGFDAGWPRADDEWAEVYSAFGQAGGVSCRWGEGDEGATYSASPMTAGQLEQVTGILEALGFTAAGSGDRVFYVAPDGRPAVFVATGDALYGVAGSSAHLDDLAPTRRGRATISSRNSSALPATR
ncbi:hypothetical protein [Herbiconiux sp. A18JL235]|uniref:DUF3558 domain-containing protein n=1 Tax=Herbiconiux sp. A18JL235 TaxID=3152363 RepID=A0AB39BGM0_9MICO